MATKVEGRFKSLTQPLVEITNMDHIVLRVKDVDASIDFYVNLLGMEPERLEAFKAGKVPFPSVRLNPDTIIDLFPFPDMEPIGDGPRNQDHFCMVVEPMDLDKLRAEVEELGIKVRNGPVLRWGARDMGQSLYIFDPDDNVVELRYYE